MTTTQNTTKDAEYEIVLEAARVAARAFSVAQKAYRAGEIGDDAFLAAKAEYDESERVFSIARGEHVAAQPKGLSVMSMEMETCKFRDIEQRRCQRKEGHSGLHDVYFPDSRTPVGLSSFRTGDAVRLSDSVVHPEFRGLIGTVKRIVKGRGVVTVNVTVNGYAKTYDALPANVVRCPNCPNCGKQMEYSEEQPMSFDEPNIPAEWFCECGVSEAVK